MTDSDIGDFDFSSDDNSDTNISNVSHIFDQIKTFVTKNTALKNINLVVEVMEIKNYPSMVFLKIGDDTGTIKSVIYKSNYKSELKSGDKIKADCYLSLYKGDLQLIIKSYKPMGLGDHNNKLVQLKKKLAGLGYFDNKPVLENNYTRIGIISSLNAAGMKDFLDTINKRCCGKTLYIYPSLVQGALAPADIAKAIQLANKHNQSEILVLIRGGGSKEDLECFNTEEIATAIFKSKIPIVTGIGHQIDTSIADLVAVKNHITPTAAAQNITTENIFSKNMLNELMNSIKHKLANYVDMHYQYIVQQENKLTKYQNKLIDQIETNLIYQNNQLDKNQKNISITMDKHYEYIISTETELSEIFASYLIDLTKSIDTYKQNLVISIDKCGRIINTYDEQIKNISQPHIISNETNKEIRSLSELVN